MSIGVNVVKGYRDGIIQGHQATKQRNHCAEKRNLAKNYLHLDDCFCLHSCNGPDKYS